MSAIRRPVSPRALFGAIGALLAMVILLTTAGCALIHGRSAPASRAGTLGLGPAQPCALVVILYRSAATMVRTEFRTMVAATARPGEHLIVIDAESSRELGSFLVPAGPTMPAPAPPAPLPPHPTQFQRAKHAKAVAAYKATVRGDLARLRAREKELLASWAARVMTKVADGYGVEPGSGELPLDNDLNSAVADFSSLSQARVALAGRKVLAVIGFDPAWAASAPVLAVGLHQASVVVTGFPANPSVQHAFRADLLWQGARRVVLLTRAASGELTVVVARGLAGASDQRALAMP